MRRTVSIVLLVLLATLAVACGGDDNPAIQSPPGGETTDPTDEPTDDCMDFSGQSASLSMGDNFFEPECFTMDKAEDLLLSNDGSAQHTFTIDGTDTDVELEPGAAENLAGPVPLDPGEYVFYCRFHGTAAGGGMSGTVTIA